MHSDAFRVLILTALLPEARAIARALSFPGNISQAIVKKEDIAIARIGLRACRLTAIAEELNPKSIVMAGLGGALSPALKIGDVVMDGALPQNFASYPNFHLGRLHTAATIVSTPAEKAALFRQTGALAVDMETDIAREYAIKRGIPFLAIRSISDDASEGLNPELLNLVDAEGRPRMGKAASFLLKHPSRLPELLRIKQATQHALSHLSAAVVALLATDWPNIPLFSPSQLDK